MVENWSSVFVLVLLTVYILGWKPSCINGATDPSDVETLGMNLKVYFGVFKGAASMKPQPKAKDKELQGFYLQGFIRNYQPS
ncbi:hypothetical protein QYF36_004982 [Acer negundo]|nr:hypothetical protein QYF36_004982 [Acer negundo]